MSNTEPEDDLRVTFERAAASVPSAPDLALRATTGARRAQRRTGVAVGTAVAGVAVIAAAGFALRGGSGASLPEPATTPAPAVSSTAAVASAQSLSGTWRPTKLDGYTTMKSARPEDPT